MANYDDEREKSKALHPSQGPMYGLNEWEDNDDDNNNFYGLDDTDVAVIMNEIEVETELQVAASLRKKQ